jgi:hypothetical protein
MVLRIKLNSSFMSIKHLKMNHTGTFLYHKSIFLNAEHDIPVHNVRVAEIFINYLLYKVSPF